MNCRQSALILAKLTDAESVWRQLQSQLGKVDAGVERLARRGQWSAEAQPAAANLGSMFDPSPVNPNRRTDTVSVQNRERLQERDGKLFGLDWLVWTIGLVALLMIAVLGYVTLAR